MCLVPALIVISKIKPFLRASNWLTRKNKTFFISEARGVIKLTPKVLSERDRYGLAKAYTWRHFQHSLLTFCFFIVNYRDKWRVLNTHRSNLMFGNWNWRKSDRLIVSKDWQNGGMQSFIPFIQRRKTYIIPNLRIWLFHTYFSENILGNEEGISLNSSMVCLSDVLNYPFSPQHWSQFIYFNT